MASRVFKILKYSKIQTTLPDHNASSGRRAIRPPTLAHNNMDLSPTLATDTPIQSQAHAVSDKTHALNAQTLATRMMRQSRLPRCPAQEASCSRAAETRSPTKCRRLARLEIAHRPRTVATKLPSHLRCPILSTRPTRRAINPTAVLAAWRTPLLLRASATRQTGPRNAISSLRRSSRVACQLGHALPTTVPWAQTMSPLHNSLDRRTK